MWMTRNDGFIARSKRVRNEFPHVNVLLFFFSQFVQFIYFHLYAILYRLFPAIYR